MAGVSQLMMPSSTSVPIIIVVRLLPVEPIMTLVSGVMGAPVTGSATPKPLL